MKHFIFFFAFLFLSPTTFAQSENTMRDYFDHFLAAISVYSPDPVMASALSAAPEVFRNGLIKRCDVQMQNVQLELMEQRYTPERYHELHELSDRAQAMRSALTGKPKPLLDFNKDKKMKEREKKRKQKEMQAAEDDKELTLELLQEKVDKLKASVDEMIKKGSLNIFSATANLKFLLDDLKEDKRMEKMREKLYSELVKKGKSLCDDAHKSQDKIFELYTVLKDGQEIINSKIDQANWRTVNCTNNEDASLVIKLYKESKDYFDIIKKGKEGAFEISTDIGEKLSLIEDVNKTIDNVNITTNDYITLQSEEEPKIVPILEEIKEDLDHLELGITKFDILKSKIDTLKLEIKATKKIYIKEFPKSKDRFNKLISTTRGINTKYVVDRAKLSEYRHKYKKCEQGSRNMFIHKYPRGFKAIAPVECISIDEAKYKMDEINLIYMGAAVAIKDNEHLSAGCVPATTKITQDDTTKKPDTTVSSVNPPTTATDTTTSKTPEKSIFGGLIIGGPSKLTVGQGAQFIALDKGGDPYPNQGGFTWSNHGQDVMVVTSSGSAATFKAGHATIVLKFDGMAAYKDVEIKAKEGDGSMGDMEEGDSYEENSVEEKCSNLIDQITISLNSGNTERARTETNKALALGCDVNAAAVAELITKIEDNEREEQLQRDRAYAALEQKRQEERRKKRQENTQNLLNLFGEKLNEISDANKPPAVYDNKVSQPVNTSQKPPICGTWKLDFRKRKSPNNPVLRSMSIASKDKETLHVIPYLIGIKHDGFYINMTYSNNASFSHTWDVKSSGRYARTATRSLTIEITDNSLRGTLIDVVKYDSGKGNYTDTYSVTGSK